MLTAGALIALAVSVAPLGYLALRAAQAGVTGVLAEALSPRGLALAGRSLALAVVVAVACAVIGVGTAFVVARTDLPGRRTFGVLAALPLAVPSYVAAFAWVALGHLVGVRFEGFWAAALVLTISTTPYVFLPALAALRGTDPALEEVARSLGRTPWQTFAEVTLPLLRPALGAGLLLAALYVLADFGAVSILRVDTFTLAIFTAFTSGFDRVGAVALSTVLVALTAPLLWVAGAQRGTRYATASGARPAAPAELGASRWVVAVLLSGWALAGLGVPLASLAGWTLAGASRPGSLGELAAAAASAMFVAGVGTIATTALALPLGVLVAREPGRLTRTLERLAYLTHALPAVVVGLSLVFFALALARPLYQSVWLLALAYATLFLPVAVSSIATSVAQAPAGVEEGAASLGLRPARVFGRVTLPLAVRGMAAGAALVALAAVKELPATLMLRPSGLDTLATRLWSHTGVGAYGAAAPYAALLIVVAIVPTWALIAGSGLTERRR